LKEVIQRDSFNVIHHAIPTCFTTADHPSVPAGLKGETEDAGKGAAVGTAPLFPDMLRSHLRHPLVSLTRFVA